MSESNDYKTFKKNVPLFGDRLDRIESAIVPGMPDINFCGEGVESWLELKSPTEPVKASTVLFNSNHKLSVEQINWMMRQKRAGGRCWVLIATNKRWMLINGSRAGEINFMTVDQLMEAAVWTATKPVIDKDLWKLLRNTITRR